MKLYYAAVLCLVAACSDDSVRFSQIGDPSGIAGDGNLKSETREVSGFQRVANDTTLPVDIAQGAQFSVVVSFDDNLLQYLKTELISDTLHISFEAPRGISPRTHGQIAITLPHLLSASNGGTSRMDIRTDEQTSLDLDNGSTGGIDFTGTVAALNATTDSTGTIHLQGSAQNANLASNGTGSIDAKSFQALTGEAKTTSTGSISATFTGSVTATSNSTGSIDLYGGGTVSAHKNGTGEINVH